MWSSTVGLLGTLIAYLCHTVRSKGFLEFSLVDIINSRSDRADGTCCNDKSRDKISGECHIGAVCALHLRICVKELINYSLITGNQGYTGKCPYGSVTTGKIDSVQLKYGRPMNYSFKIEFAWMTSFTIIIELFDRNRSKKKSHLIDQRISKEVLVPSHEWANYIITSTSGPGVVTYKYRMRMRCAPNYFNVTCTKFCAARNDYHGHYSCDKDGNKVCKSGWMGDACNTAICKSGCRKGSCTEPNTCVCENGWLGPLCDECIKYPGCKHGTCGTSPYTCSCFMNYGGALCDKDLNYCGRHKPCHNKGLCFNLNNEKQPYKCVCRRGWTGLNCLLKHDPCKLGALEQQSPCRNNATCVPLSDNVLGSDVASLVAHRQLSWKPSREYVCKCKLGWTGENCDQDINECLLNPCQNGATCNNLIGFGYTCSCQPDFMGINCQLVKERCINSPCSKSNTARCELYQDEATNHLNYKCDCLSGWESHDCSVKKNNCVGQPCRNGGICSDLGNMYVCSCTQGWTGLNCTEDVNECHSSPCLNSGLCINERNNYRCDCQGTGYLGQHCEINENPCQPNPCQNGGYCYMIGKDVICRCTDEYEGKNCERERPKGCGSRCNTIDPCTIPSNRNNSFSTGIFIPLERSNVCSKHGTCLNKGMGQYTCSCDRGWHGHACEENINDCRDQPCLNGGTCIDGINAYTCICFEGWEGHRCQQDKNECKTNPCRNGGRCVDRFNGYQCICPIGWQGRWCHLSLESNRACDNRTCANNGICQLNHKSPNGFLCLCQTGWAGDTCQSRINDTCAKLKPCLNAGTCVNVGETFACLCHEGFEGSHCERNVNECNPYPCFNGGKCIDRINHFVCQCPTGFSGPDCRIDLDECASNPCPYGSTCIDGVGNFTCRCQLGFNCNTQLLVKNDGACIHKRRVRRRDEVWTSDCQTCRCLDGKVSCTQAFCGMYTCWQARHNPDDWFACKPNEVCFSLPQEKCLVADCTIRGICRNISDINGSSPVHQMKEWELSSYLPCGPNSDLSQISENCAKMNLTFDLTLLPIGTTVTDVCREILMLPNISRMRYYHTNDGFRLQCDRYDVSSVVQVALFNSLKSCVGPCFLSAQQLAQNIGWDIRKHSWLQDQQLMNEWKNKDPRGAFPILSAVIEIHGNNLFEKQGQKWSSYVIPVVCIIMGVICVLVLILMIVLYNRHQKNMVNKSALNSLTKNNVSEEVKNVPCVYNHLFDEQQPLFYLNINNTRRKENSLELPEENMRLMQNQSLSGLQLGGSGLAEHQMHYDGNKSSTLTSNFVTINSLMYQKSHSIEIARRNVKRQRSQHLSDVGSVPTFLQQQRSCNSEYNPARSFVI